ncbi:MAG TPA: hypothetical protein VNS55_08935 [Nocardioides sp.]|nr:hypothetical protein [Nocardioides sp.]
MSEHDEQGPQRPAETEWQRKRRLAEVFGDVLPEVTRDERDPGEDRGDGESASDRWLKSQVPPHHG